MCLNILKEYQDYKRNNSKVLNDPKYTPNNCPDINGRRHQLVNVSEKAQHFPIKSFRVLKVNGYNRNQLTDDSPTFFKQQSCLFFPSFHCLLRCPQTSTQYQIIAALAGRRTTSPKPNKPTGLVVRAGKGF